MTPVRIADPKDRTPTCSSDRPKRQWSLLRAHAVPVTLSQMIKRSGENPHAPREALEPASERELV